MEWTISIEGKSALGDVCRQEVRIEKSDERLLDGDIGLSIDDGKKIMTALQSAVVNHEADTYALSRRVCPDCHTFRPVKDYTMRRIRTVFGTVEVRNPRWMLCQNCHPGMVAAFAPLKEICPDRATSDLMELTARLGSMMPYRQAASVLAEFLPIEPTETHATVRKRTIKVGERLDALRKPGARECRWRNDISSKCSFLAIDAKSSSSASIRRTFAAPIPIQRETSSSSSPDAVAEVGETSAVATLSPPILTNLRYAIERFTLFGKRGIAALGTSP
ncbi:hypothetical protein [Mesorhizobium sp. M0088]|uniref:hypothetical protein n=1 Tax=Mesorhizobium sp. M0088 TaxID=2956873 RepID=UPI00333DF174